METQEMSRIPTPAAIEAAPAASQQTLNAIKDAFGSAPNMFRLISNSPAALEGLWSLWTALGRGQLSAATRERIALAVANVNGCSYCNSAHGYIAKHVAKIDDAEIAANRVGRSTDDKADAAVRFAVKLTRDRGAVMEADLAPLRNLGYSDAAIVEIVGVVALNIFTNYINEALGTDIDFPVAKADRAA
jgi:uncharacterized peroxidase-related enzyme